MLPEDLGLLRTPGVPTLTPDGRLAIVAVTRLDLEADAYRSRLWAVPTDGSEPPRLLTQGWRDTQPQVSPDGRWLAFTRAADAEAKPQLHVMAMSGGDARRVTELPLGVEEFCWAPDSRRVALLARVPEPGRYGTDPERGPDREPPRRITTLHHRWDGTGFLLDRPRHLHVVDVLAEGGDAVQWTTTDADHDHPLWLADGRLLVIRDHDLDRVLRTDLVLLPEAGREEVVALPLWIEGRLAQEADGSLLVTAVDPGPGGRDFAGRPASLYRVSLDGSPQERLTDPAAVEVATDRAPSLQVLPDGSLLHAVLHRGAVHLVRRSADGSSRVVVGGGRQVVGWGAVADVLVATVATDTSAGELIRVDGAERVLTAFGAELAESGRLHPMHELEATAPDGYPVHGWVVLPSGEGPHPVLLMVHGGPHAQYGWTLLDEAQAYAQGGYAVVMGNPRGSAGYGEAHGRAVVHAFGDRDAVDVLALLDAALERPDLDGSRVGVLGGSYGGFMAGWLAAHHGGRFGAALVERGALAFESFIGSSDIGHWFVDAFNGTDLEEIRRQSPLTYADQIRIPTLVVHSEQDWRCPVEQGQRLFALLKRNGVETELLLFPGEGHELTRSGLPSHRVVRLAAVVEWFDRHLGGAGRRAC